MSTISGVTLFEGEEVVYQTKPSWVQWFWSIILGVPFSLVIVGLWPLWKAYRARSGTTYAVTTDRVIEKTGNRNVTVDDTRLDDIAKVSTEQSRRMLLFTVGTVLIDIQHGGTMKFEGVPDASRFVAAIRERQ
ncbi:PH domain-containing protein [Halogeometricum limi]|uniref:PH domain-containing protein n=1 Tax=Halogeometricum limi TaxID=555875 RepID=A0A1I6FXW7_9EURY|nr:PH domain-containing protein [Halogeometricum limi]SFR34778.1 PH domain-containing protein [Halogeometricum limi]